MTSSLRCRAELLVPGFVVGFLAGGLAGGIAALAGLPLGYVVATMVALGVPMALFGAGYSALLAAGRLRIGGVAPAVAYWMVGFPLSRAAHELLLDVMVGRSVGLPDEVLPFLAYQALLSVGFGIGFVWLHEQLAPIWWLRVRNHNPVAQRYIDLYARQAHQMEQQKAARSQKKKRAHSKQEVHQAVAEPAGGRSRHAPKKP